ncbi:hypothetical protein ACFWNT_24870 [Streptomyces sp. NPDC058409]|uniref:hypothetical protein n=1 Tax=Streptomyces sp. NPDC058409 TaxID=3346484 RepID=UPI00365DCA0D
MTGWALLIAALVVGVVGFAVLRVRKPEVAERAGTFADDLDRSPDRLSPMSGSPHPAGSRTSLVGPDFGAKGPGHPARTAVRSRPHPNAELRAQAWQVSVGEEEP